MTSAILPCQTRAAPQPTPEYKKKKKKREREREGQRETETEREKERERDSHFSSVIGRNANYILHPASSEMGYTSFSIKTQRH